MKHQPAAKTTPEAPAAPEPTVEEPAAAQAPPANAEAELTAHLQRLQAEFNNYRKRADADVASALERGRDRAIKDLLPVLDSFALAKTHAQPAAKPAGNPHKPAAADAESELSKGFTLIYSQLKKLLDEWQVTEVPATGLVDPKLHEVYITETVADKPAGTILLVLQPGYLRNGTVLRTAKVKAARN